MDKPTSYKVIGNQATIALDDIPIVSYDQFARVVSGILQKDEHQHCINYYAYPITKGLKFIACIADDRQHHIKVLSHESTHDEKLTLQSLSKDFFPIHIFEREIAENFGVHFEGHPWPKPMRYAFNRADKNQIINNYPFFQIDGNELHQVGVGPIHASIIEPGHFRFLCNGENVLHLEIQLGWQHRGVEHLYLENKSLLQRTVLSESIAGDTAIGHAMAFAQLMESLGSIKINPRLELERVIGLELERIAMHVGDLGNMNIGTAYQLAASVFGTLRTPAINYTQTWCGNRFGKGLIRIGGSHYPFNTELADKLEKFLTKFEDAFDPMCDRTFALPSDLMRFEGIGKVTLKQMELIGAVGMTARMAGLQRDIRITHPFAAYLHYNIPSDTLEQGDVWARAYLRKIEVKHSIQYIRSLIGFWKSNTEKTPSPLPEKDLRLSSNAFAISLTEGWRGEICHSAITNDTGEIIHYKVKDPSVHNWMALALSLRDLEISDFPINNKSYNLSYCGHDL